MKNLKSIIYVCIAAVLLLGVTACQEPLTYKTPVGLTAVVDKTDYLIGETFDPSTATITVYFTDNSSQNFKGSQLAYKLYSDEACKTEQSDAKIAAATYVQFEYGTNAKVSNKTVINGHKGLFVELANLPTTATWDATESEAVVDTKAITGVVTLDDGTTREVSVAAKSLVVTPKLAEDPVVTATSKDVEVTYTATVFGELVTVKPADEPYTVDVVTVAPVFNEDATSYTLSVEYSLNEKKVEGYNASATGKFYIGDNLTWKILIADDENVTKEVPLADFYVKDNAKAEQKVELGRESKAEYTLIYKGDYTVADSEIEIAIPNGENWIKSVAFNGYADNYAPKAGTAVTPENLKFTVEYGDNNLTETEKTSLQWKATTTTVIFIDNATPKADSTFEPEFYYTWKSKGETKVAYDQLPSTVIPKA